MKNTRALNHFFRHLKMSWHKKCCPQMHSNVTNVAKSPFFPYFVIYNMTSKLLLRKSDVGCTPATSKKLSELPISHITGASGVSQKHGCSFWSHTPEAPSLNSTTNQRTGLQKQVHIPIEDYQHSYRFFH